MFTKKKHVGSAHAFKTVVNWDAVLGAVVVGGVLLAIFS